MSVKSIVKQGEERMSWENQKLKGTGFSEKLKRNQGHKLSHLRGWCETVFSVQLRTPGSLEPVTDLRMRAWSRGGLVKTSWVACTATVSQTIATDIIIYNCLVNYISLLSGGLSYCLLLFVSSSLQPHGL